MGVNLRSCISALALVATALVGCGRTTVGTPPRAAVAAPATTTTAASRDHDDDDTARPALDERRRGELGLPPFGVPPASWAPLTPAQWADPEAVAARYVLVDTTYATAEDPGGVAARRAEYATARLAADLTTSSSGGARLEELRRRHTAYSARS